MRRRDFLTLVVVAGAALVSGACGTTGASTGGQSVNTTPAPNQAAGLGGTSWALKAFGDGTPPVAGSQVTLKFNADASEAGGNASINSYRGQATSSGSALSFGPMMSTMMGGAPELMTQETNYLKALEQTASYQLTGGDLTLLDAAGNPILIFGSAT